MNKEILAKLFESEVPEDVLLAIHWCKDYTLEDFVSLGSFRKEDKRVVSYKDFDLIYKIYGTAYQLTNVYIHLNSKIFIYSGTGLEGIDYIKI